jgi:hypothetical protein
MAISAHGSMGWGRSKAHVTVSVGSVMVVLLED